MNKTQYVSILVIGLLLSALTVLGLVAFWGMNSLLISPPNLALAFITLTFSFVFLALFGFTLLKVVKKFKSKKPVFSRKNLVASLGYLVVTLLATVLSSFLILLVWGVLSDEPPHFFPLNDPEGEYRVTTGCPSGRGWSEVEKTDTAYCVEYRGKHVFLNDEKQSDFFRITVGDSKVNLKPFVGKNVIIQKGRYTSRSHQCINGTCTYIGGPFVVLDIDQLELAE